jgi:hypothetical protein
MKRNYLFELPYLFKQTVYMTDILTKNDAVPGLSISGTPTAATTAR